jgi:hypothetical protein
MGCHWSLMARRCELAENIHLALAAYAVATVVVVVALLVLVRIERNTRRL